MLIGYARVSTDDQNLELQRDALQAAGCAHVFEDVGISGGASRRPGLSRALAALNPGDALVVWKLDRLGRSMPHLVATLADLTKRGIGFRSLTEAIDTTTPAGRLMGHMLGALAEFERSMIGERTRAGMAAARRRGRHVGRPSSLSPADLDNAKLLLAEGQPIATVARTLRVCRATLYRYLARDLQDAA